MYDPIITRANWGQAEYTVTAVVPCIKQNAITNYYTLSPQIRCHLNISLQFYIQICLKDFHMLLDKTQTIRPFLTSCSLLMENSTKQ